MGKKIKNLWKKQGFTLVELIIVIAIIAVLAVSAFMMLTKWLSNSRDSRRIADANTIQSALNIHMGDLDNSNGLLPMPDDAVEISASGSVIGYQGSFGVDTIAQMDNMQKVPLDPSDTSEYTYYITADKKKFQILTYLEKDEEVASIIGNTVLAIDYNNRYEEAFGYNLGIITDTNKTPIQDLGFTGIDLVTASGNYNIVFKENIVEDVTPIEILSNIIILQKKDELLDLDSSLVGYWDMETTLADGRVKDLSQYGNHGRFNHNYNEVLVETVSVDGQVGRAIDFDGSDGTYIESPMTDSLTITGDMTITAWVKPRVAPIGLGRVIAGTYDRDSNTPLQRGWVFGNGFGNGDFSYLRVFKDNGTFNQVSYGTFFSENLNQWVKTTAVFKGGEYMAYYINGEQIGYSPTEFTEIANKVGTNFRIGMRADNTVQGLWDGYIDDLKLYKRALSKEEIKALYDNTK